MRNAIIFGMVPKSKLKIYLFLYNILFNFAYQTKFNNVELSICGILSTQKAWNINHFGFKAFRLVCSMCLMESNLHEVLTVVKFIKKESRMVAARG